MTGSKSLWVLPVVVAMCLTACGGGRDDDTEQDPYPSSLTTQEAAEAGVEYRMIPATCLLEPTSDGLTPEEVTEAEEAGSGQAAPWLAPQPDQGLEVALDNAVDGARADLDTEVGIVLVNHTTGETTSVNADTEVSAASLSKVTVALSYLRHLKEQDLDLSEQDQFLLEDSLANSGNESTAALFAQLGEDDAAATEYLTETYRMIGTETTEPDFGWGTESTTASDQGVILETFSSTPDWVRAEDMDQVRDYLNPTSGYPSYTQHFGVGVLADPANWPPGAVVESLLVKNSWLPDDDGRWSVSTIGQTTIDDEVLDIVITSHGAPNSECGYALLNDLVLLSTQSSQ